MMNQKILPPYITEKWEEHFMIADMKCPTLEKV